MKHVTTLKIVLAISVFTGGTAATRGETIQAGIQSISPSAPATSVPGTIDSAYITATFGTNDYIQDSSGGIYAYQGAATTGALKGLSVGTEVFGLTTSATGGFSLFTNAGATNSQFEFTPSSAVTTAMTVTGTVSSIPASFYQTQTINTLNTNQGGLVNGAIVQGYQNNLVTINNATIETSTGGAITAGSMFVASTAYRIQDATGFATLYIYNSAATPNSLVGTTIPTGTVNVSGIDTEFTGAPEIQPRGTFDIQNTAVPEPATYVMGFLTVAVGAYGFLRRQKICL